MIRNCVRHVGGKLEALAIKSNLCHLAKTLKMAKKILIIAKDFLLHCSLFKATLDQKAARLALTTSESSAKGNQHESRPITKSPCPQRLLQGLGLCRSANSMYCDPSLLDGNEMLDYHASPSRKPGDIVKYLISSGLGDSTTKKKFSWTGCYEMLQDLGSLVLKRRGTWSERYQPNTIEGNEVKLMAHIFKSQNLTAT